MQPSNPLQDETMPATVCCLFYAEPPHTVDALQAVLSDAGLQPSTIPSVGALLQRLRQPAPHLVVAALRPELAYALDVVAAIREAAPLAPLVVVGAFEAPAERLRLTRQHQAYDVVPPSPEGLGQLALALQGATRHVERLLGTPALAAAGPSAPPAATTDEQAVRLTARELEVLREVAEGRSNAEAARRLKLSAHTVRNTLYRVYGKLGADSRTHAVAVARSSQLL
ncbi:MAG: LuxR C-terminal-related transcriptional regulator [Candidatus Sericytochromatia bacterium]|nr:LuxR C-terminal-related transcriptional regulator [Candidatus Sericytochromatia bacterium]